MIRRLWPMPILSAMYWGACQEPGRSYTEHSDARFAICGFCASMAALLLANGFIK